MQYWKLLVVVVLFIAAAFLVSQVFQTSKISNIESIGTQQTSECADGSRQECTMPEDYVGFRTCTGGAYSSQCYIANIDECRIASGDAYKVCCKTPSVALQDCTDKKDFQAGEYVIIKTNLQKLAQDTNLDIYRACGFSKLNETVSEMPSHYDRTTNFSDAESGVGCSVPLFVDDFHQGTIDGFIPAGSGAMNVSEWRIFAPNIDTYNPERAIANKALSSSGFALEVDVSA